VQTVLAMRFLAVLPFLGILVGTPFFNRVEPLIFGLPLILAWLVLWILLTSAIMAVIYRADPANRREDTDA
jgi:xanthosine utilization system XapX-like protein